MKKWLLIACPYFVCVVVGTALFVVASALSGDASSLFLGIAGAFFAIPCLYVLYESARRFSNRKLTQELFEYAKMQIDTEVLSIVNQLMKIAHPYEERDFTLNGIRAFLALSEVDLRTALQGNEYLGFQVLKDWSVSIRNAIAILENPFILQRLDNDQAISVVALLKRLTSFEVIHKRVSNLYRITNKQAEGYKVQAGREISDRNVEYPDRYLLLRHLIDDKYVVADFGDFPLYQVPKLLNICKMNKAYTRVYADELFGLVQAVNDWLYCTGNEFIIDPKTFKFAFAPTNIESERERQPT